MKIGDLRHRVAIQTNTPSFDPNGGEIPSWATDTTVWAAVQTLTGNKREIARQIDREVRKLVEEAYDTARQTILAHRDRLVEIAERLTREETIDAAAFNAMFA